MRIRQVLGNVSVLMCDGSDSIQREQQNQRGRDDAWRPDQGRTHSTVLIRPQALMP